MIVVLALRTVRSVTESEAVVRAFAPLAAVCDGQAAQAAAAYDGEADAPATVAFRRLGDEWRLEPGAAPEGWQALSMEEAQLVLCLEPQPLVATVCAPDDSGALPTRVYGELLTVRLFAAQRGEQVAEGTLQSVPARDCGPEEVEAAPAVSMEVVRGWLREEIGN
ncbi:MAG TPA: hypothetical protein VK879_02925 [Candidatus Sulfomarinibacteraceae bacterium]|nr:hypothetical protein [Candidatus Sulfomarinibacteraceae bacterium]